MKTVIDVATTRGAFKANEMLSVGTVYNKLEAFPNAVSKINNQGILRRSKIMADLKHVGRLTTNNRKLIVAYRVLPDDPDNCLVVHTESLDAADHDELIKLVESNAIQTEDSFS